MRQKFINKNVSAARLEMMHICDKIITEFHKRGYTMSVRQIYYQCVAKNIIPNNKNEYDKIGDIIVDGRMLGIIDFDMIVDRHRSQQKWYIQESLTSILTSLPRKYASDLWRSQDTYIEVWVEKDALTDVVAQACNGYRVPYLACKGYISLSETYLAAKRFQAAHALGKRCLILHIGDHDPSGMDMTRDNQARVSQIAGFKIDINRIGLNMNQVEELNLPAQYAKMTDGRVHEYIEKYGDKSWEVDALDPDYVKELIETEIDKHIDSSYWNDALSREEYWQDKLSRIYPIWDKILKITGKKDDPTYEEKVYYAPSHFEDTECHMCEGSGQEFYKNDDGSYDDCDRCRGTGMVEPTIEYCYDCGEVDVDSNVDSYCPKCQKKRDDEWG